MTVDIDRLAALHAKAAHGPWWVGNHHGNGAPAVENPDRYVAQLIDPASAPAIAEIHNALPELLDELRTARKDLADAQELIRAARAIADGSDNRPRPSIDRIRDLRQLLDLA